MKLICLGDSITGPSPGLAYLDKYMKWSDLLQVGLGAVFGVDRVQVLNQAQAGGNSAGLVAALDDRLLRHRPDCAVLLIGGNNYGNNTPPAEAAAQLTADLREIVDRAHAAGIRILLMQYATPRADDMTGVWKHLDAGNPVIAAVAREKNVPLLALAPAFDEAARHAPLATLAHAVDGVHLNPGGEIVIANAVLAKLRELGWPHPWPELLNCP
jgi:lysophospholipase L1-like esterase